MDQYSEVRNVGSRNIDEDKVKMHVDKVLIWFEFQT